MGCAGQVECKRLVSTDAIDWSVAMQMGGQVHAIAQPYLSQGFAGFLPHTIIMTTPSRGCVQPCAGLRKKSSI
jgi:hypothetical protein